MIIRGTIIGILSGLALGFYLKLIEVVTGIKVYTLLLNIDFIPVMGDIAWPEWIEFAFHVIISIIICIIYVYGLKTIIPDTRKSRWIFAFVLTFPTIFLFFPLSYLAIKDVPAMSDMTAFFWWITGHLVYFVTMPPLYRLFYKPKK